MARCGAENARKFLIALIEETTRYKAWPRCQPRNRHVDFTGCVRHRHRK